MFGTIRRHQNWLWLVIIAVIIVTFVIWFSPDVKFGRSFRPTAADFGAINGQPIKLEEYRDAELEARLNSFLRSGGKWPEHDQATLENLRRDAVMRAFLIRKLREYQIHVSDKAIARLASERFGDQVANNLRQFEKEYLAAGGISLDDFGRYLTHEAGIQQLLQAATAGARLIEPREAEALFREENERLVTEMGLFNASNYLDKVAVTPEAVTNFYTRQQALYRVPERVKVDYVAFYASNFLADADKAMAQQTNLNARIDEAYLRQGPDNFKGTNDAKLSETEAKARIKDMVRQDFALAEARRKANDFGTDVYNQGVTNVADFEKLAAAKGLEVKPTPPFDRTKGLEDTAFPAGFRQRAFDLVDKQAVSFSPIVTTNAVYLVALKEKIPSQMPALHEIRDKVTADYKHSQAVDLARAAGRVFDLTLTNALAQKKPFGELAAQAKAPLVTVPPFSLSSSLTNAIEGVSPRLLMNVASSLKPGQASQFVPTAEGGMIVYLKERVPVSPEQVKQDMPEFVGRLRFYRQNEAFNQWFRKQAELARLVIPQKEDTSTPAKRPSGSGGSRPKAAPKSTPAPKAAPAPAPATPPATAPAPPSAAK